MVRTPSRAQDFGEALSIFAALLLLLKVTALVLHGPLDLFAYSIRVGTPTRAPEESVLAWVIVGVLLVPGTLLFRYRAWPLYLVTGIAWLVLLPQVQIGDWVWWPRAIPVIDFGLGGRVTGGYGQGAFRVSALPAVMIVLTLWLWFRSPRGKIRESGA